MPVTLTYPGVYIEEISSGVRTISGVATSVAAFVGWAPKGPTDAAYKVNSWSDYDRMFGGLDPRSYLGYAVYHFFSNGGQQAYIVRVAGTDATPASVTLDVLTKKLTLTATGPGQWAEVYRIDIQSKAGDLFRLDVVHEDADASPGSDGKIPGSVVESFERLSLDKTNPRFVELLLNEESAIVNAKVGAALAPAAPPAVPPEPPAAPPVPAAPDAPGLLKGGVDGEPLDPGTPAFITAMKGTEAAPGINTLEHIDLFNLLCVPGLTDAAAIDDLQKFCRDHRAFLIADAAQGASKATLAEKGPEGLTGKNAINAAFYYPWIKAPDALQEGRTRLFPPSGFVAGLYAYTDTNRGVWKAPAGTDASLSGAIGVETALTDLENGALNTKAINCIRTFPNYGTVIWGARTLKGSNEEGNEWKYIPVRRTALFIEESLFRGLKWVVFEPNDEPLWASIRLNAGAFMQNLFRQGAFQGSSPREAYFVKCDRETTTQNDINLGIVNIVVGFAPLKPAEFVVIKLQQLTGQIAV